MAARGLVIVCLSHATLLVLGIFRSSFLSSAFEWICDLCKSVSPKKQDSLKKCYASISADQLRHWVILLVRALCLSLYLYTQNEI
jgi:hypothetical protein